VGALAVLPFSVMQTSCEPPPTPACHVTVFRSGGYDYATEADGCLGLTESTYEARAVMVCLNGARPVSAYVRTSSRPFTTTTGCPAGAVKSAGHELRLR
jgi:hypothetical protein